MADDSAIQATSAPVRAAGQPDDGRRNARIAIL
jgi:hypothetical protein